MKKLISTLFLLLLTTQVSYSAEYKLHPFTSDGCSMSPDGPVPGMTTFLDCCFMHDIAYWMGGTKDDKKVADLEFKGCIEDTGHPLYAKAYYAAVRVNGGAMSQFTFRWGYGWEPKRDYGILTDTELNNAFEMLPDDLATIEIASPTAEQRRRAQDTPEEEDQLGDDEF